MAVASHDEPGTPAAIDPALRRTAVVVVLGAIMTVLDTTIVNVAVHTLGRDLHASLSTTQWVLTGYMLALSMAIPVTGWATERFGGRRIWITSLLLFTMGSVLCGAAWSIYSLIAFRALQGLGGGMLLPVGQTMLARAAGPERMGRVMSVIAVPAMLAPVLGPVLGGLIVDHLAWRWMFFVNVPVCVVALVAAVRLLPADTERQPNSRLDAVGLVLLSPGLAALVYGLSAAGNGAGWSSPRLVVGTGLGAALIAGFCWHALRGTDRPLLDLRLFRHRPFSAAVAGLFCYAAAVFGLIILLPLYFQIVRAGSPLDAGLLLAPLGLGAIVTMSLAGRITDRRGPREVAAVGVAVVLLGAVAFTLTGPTTGWLLLAGAVFVVGLGHGVVIPALTAATYLSVPRTAVPAATTASNIIARVAGFLGTAVLAVILQLYLRAAGSGGSGTLPGLAVGRSTDVLAGAFTHSFWWAVAIGLVALLPVLALPRRTSAAGPAGAPSDVVDAGRTVQR